MKKNNGVLLQSATVNSRYIDVFVVVCICYSLVVNSQLGNLLRVHFLRIILVLWSMFSLSDDFC